jgi:ArsR family transcriptional regulator
MGLNMVKSTEAFADACDVACLHPEIVNAARVTLPSPAEAERLAAVFGVLADPTRVRLVQALSERELCVCDLSNVLGMRQSAVSHQLRLLRTMHVVKARNAGRVVYYRLDDDHVAELLAHGLAHIRAVTTDRADAQGVA